MENVVHILQGICYLQIKTHIFHCRMFSSLLFRWTSNCMLRIVHACATLWWDDKVGWLHLGQ